MKLKVWMLCLAGCLAVATTADAQQGRGRGFGGGFGGFGGPGAYFFLVQNEAVQKDLALSGDAADKVKKIVEDYNTANREGTAGLQAFGPNSNDADREKAQTIRKENTDKYFPKLKEALTADQFTRLQQINWQNLGTAALSEADVVKTLTITKDQQDKIKSLTEEYQGKTRELFAGGGGGGREAFQANMEKMQEINKERDGKINDVLTKDQKDKFAMMKGKEFDVAQLRQFGRGRGPGGGGPGGAGGGGNGGDGGGRSKRPQPKAE